MTVIDKILNEWSFRCHDGIVDLNDPNKVKVLKEMISDKELINLFNSIEDEDKEKIIKKIKKFSKGTSKELIIELNKKNLSKISKSIIELAEEYNQEDELLKCLKSGISFDNLSDNGNLKDKFKNVGIEEKFSIELIKLIYIESNRLVGKGEVALIILLNNAKKSKSKGDIEVDSKTIEVKSKRSKMAIESLGIKNVEDINKLIKKLVNNLSNNTNNFNEIIDKKGIGWPNKLNSIYQEYVNIKLNKKEEFEKQLENFLKELYSNSFDTTGLDISNVNEFKIKIAKKLAEEYKIKTTYDSIVFIDDNANYKIFDKKNIVDNIGKEIKISEFSDSIPRLSYTQSSLEEEEEPTLEEILFSLRAK